MINFVVYLHPNNKTNNRVMKNKKFYPWLVVALLWVVALLNYMDRQMLSTMQAEMKADIVELQQAEAFGALMAVFLWVYGIVSPFAGIVADRISRKKLVVGSLFVWSLVTYLMEAREKKSKDMLLDKFTLRYAKFVDVDAALAWIKEEEEVGDTVPQNIKDAFPGTSPSQTTLYDLEKAFAASHQELILFADNDYTEWDYEDRENGWQPQFMNRFVIKSQTTTFCLMESEQIAMVEPIVAMCREIKAWAKGGDVKKMKNPWASKGLYPIAYIDGSLYFMSNKEHAQLNAQWGNDTMFFVRTDNPIASAKSMDLSYKPSAMLLKLAGDEFKEIHTYQLGEILQTKSNGLIDEFISYAKQNGGNLKISYQDEHLKSIMGMMITIQTIWHIVKQIGSNFDIEFKVEAYRDDKGNANKICTNMPSSEVRDKWLTNFTNAWIDDLKYDQNIEGHLLPVVSVPKRTLTHWRVLSITCGNKKLSIYPDGGFINEWNIARQPNGERFEVETITYDTKIYLYRNKDIKFDIAIENC